MGGGEGGGAFLWLYSLKIFKSALFLFIFKRGLLHITLLRWWRWWWLTFQVTPCLWSMLHSWRRTQFSSVMIVSSPKAVCLFPSHSHERMHTHECTLDVVWLPVPPPHPFPFKPTGMLVFDYHSSPSGPHVWLPEQSIWTSCLTDRAVLTPCVTARTVFLGPMFDCQSSPDPMFDCESSPDPMFDCQSSPSGPHVWLPEQSWTPCSTARAVLKDPMFDCQSSPSGPHVWLPEQSLRTPCLTARAVLKDPMF